MSISICSRDCLHVVRRKHFFKTVSKANALECLGNFEEMFSCTGNDHILMHRQQYKKCHVQHVKNLRVIQMVKNISILLRYYFPFSLLSFSEGFYFETAALEGSYISRTVSIILCVYYSWYMEKFHCVIHSQFTNLWCEWNLLKINFQVVLIVRQILLFTTILQTLQLLYNFTNI